MMFSQVSICIIINSKNAIIVPEGKIAEVDEINCDGCGICATCCPTQAIQIRYYTDDQIFNQVLALIKEVNV
ncbi:unnamed protein product [marine sediment metagenome]|uniref:4Fe-4S ferredoxin-type domain-containing protein n=1 Tax=marine sediment metagenome TaxID=412755 RepID=X1K138_9ZZZZ